MKIVSIFISLTIAAMVAFTSCQKDDATTELTEVSLIEKLNGGDYSKSENLYSEAYQLVELEVQKEPTLNGLKADEIQLRGACPTVTVNPPSNNVFPKTVTLDFGTGCTTKNGKTASGKIIAVFSGAFKQKSTNVTVTFQSFKYKGYTLEGTYLVTYTSTTGFTVQITNGKIVTPEAKTITYQATFMVVQTEGITTNYRVNGEAGILDDVYSISGGGSGTDQTGKSYTVTITTPLIKKMNCEWISTGVAEIKITGQATKKLDFGAGTCDNAASLTVGRLSTPITLP